MRPALALLLLIALAGCRSDEDEERALGQALTEAARQCATAGSSLAAVHECLATSGQGQLMTHEAWGTCLERSGGRKVCQTIALDVSWGQTLADSRVNSWRIVRTEHAPPSGWIPR